MHFLQSWMETYGYTVLGIALVLELLAVPLPGEVLMTYAGLLVFQGKLNGFLSILTAGAGASIGMTISYWIGFKLGTPFIEKYGRYVHLGPDRLAKTSQWFERFGSKLLIIAYFIPGVRHITGYFSGVTRLPFPKYAAYAYTGAFFWTGTFISLGRLLGPEWEAFHRSMTKYLILGGMAAAVFVLLYGAFRRYREQLYPAAAGRLDQTIRVFHSFGRVKYVLAVSLAAFLALFLVMLGLIQDFLAHEFSDFDAVAAYIIHAILDDTWKAAMNHLLNFSSMQVLLGLSAVTLIWVLTREKERWLEAFFLLFVLIGGFLWEIGLRQIFHRAGPHYAADTFPSAQTFIVIIFMGFAAYLLVRHVHAAWIHTGVLLLVLAVSLLVGVSRIYLNLEYPSDVVAGYVFGGVWLTLNIVLLEIFRNFRSRGKVMA